MQLKKQKGERMFNNPLLELEKLHQSIWLDYIKRDMFQSGLLKKLIKEDGLRGMTSNPDIFEKAITQSHDYDAEILALIKEKKDAKQIYMTLTKNDVRSAADEFNSVFDKTHKLDGYVSLEVNPHLAYDTEGTLQEARMLWREVDRPNIFIKVPATKPGILAIQQLISEGININITLLFGVSRYKEVLDAYLAGIENRVQQNKSVDNIVSVASFFLSRIDVVVDPLLQKISDLNLPTSNIAKSLQGQVAILSAKNAYLIFENVMQSLRVKKLLEKGMRPQRLLWASTSTKNPQYSDIKYIDSIIAPHTVNTIPMETLDAYRDHGKPAVRIYDDIEKTEIMLGQLPDLGIDLNKITQQLEDDGVIKFNNAYDKLIKTLESSLVTSKD